MRESIPSFICFNKRLFGDRRMIHYPDNEKNVLYHWIKFTIKDKLHIMSMQILTGGTV